MCCPSHTKTNLGNGFMKIAFIQSSTLLQECCLLQSDHSSCHLLYQLAAGHIFLEKIASRKVVSRCLPSSTILKPSQQVRHACGVWASSTADMGHLAYLHKSSQQSMHVMSQCWGMGTAHVALYYKYSLLIRHGRLSRISAGEASDLYLRTPPFCKLLQQRLSACRLA